jgi:type II secretory pathway component PulF
MAKAKTGPSAFERKFAKLQFGFGRRLKFYQQLAALTRTGMPKTDALNMLYMVASREGKKKNEALAVVTADIIARMTNGEGFGQAIRPWVPIDDVMVLEAIESSDDFAKFVEEYCEMLVGKAKIVSTIKGGLTYPVALLSAIYGLMYYFGAEVTPKIEPLLAIEEWTGPASFLAFLNRFANELAIPITLCIITVIVVVTLTLKRWVRFGRTYADKLPIYSTYRMYTGISFMTSVAALIQGGMPVIGAVEKILPLSPPYVKYRLKMVYRHMLNGENFGAALYRTGTGWPDQELNLSLKIFAETADLSQQLSRLAKDSLKTSQDKIATSMDVIKSVTMCVVFAVILGIVGGMYGLQDLIAQKLQ